MLKSPVIEVDIFYDCHMNLCKEVNHELFNLNHDGAASVIFLVGTVQAQLPASDDNEYQRSETMWLERFIKNNYSFCNEFRKRV